MLRPKLNRVWTSSNAVLRRDPGDVKYLQGWVSEIPTYQVLNYLQYKVDTTLLALAERGVFEWGTDIQYRLGSVVWDETDSKIYVAKVASPNKTTKPSSNLTQWEASSIQVSRASYDAIVAKINAHIADITSNPHKLTAGMLDAYNKNELDNIVAQYQAIVLAHASDKNNPHKLTATGIGAVPITGGAYTGDVTFQAGVYFDAAKSNKLSTASGFFLQSAAAMLGIDSTGKPVAGASSTTLSPLVTEQTFPALKAAREPLFATPLPVFQMDLINSIDLRYGKGTSDSGSLVPTYAAEDGAISFTNTISGSGTNQNINCDADASVGTGNVFTLCYDIMMLDPATTTGSVVFELSIPSYSLRIYANNRALASRTLGSLSDNPTSNVVLTSNEWHRLCATYEGDVISLYVDGVLYAQKTNSSQTAATTTTGIPRLVNFSIPVAGVRNYKVRNARIFTQALTPEQVSTL